MSNEILRVSHSFAQETDHGVEAAGERIFSRLFTIPEYTDPPVTQEDLEAGILALSKALAAQKNGGPLATARKKDAKEALVGMLRNLASFVQTRCKNDLALLLASGFDVVSNNRTRIQLEQPVIKRLANGLSGQIVVSMEAGTKARSWQVESAVVGEDGVQGRWISANPGTDSRRLIVDSLIPGKLYVFRVRGVGGTTGCSDWSNTVTFRAM